MLRNSVGIIPTAQIRLNNMIEERLPRFTKNPAVNDPTIRPKMPELDIAVFHF